MSPFQLQTGNSTLMTGGIVGSGVGLDVGFFVVGNGVGFGVAH